MKEKVTKFMTRNNNNSCLAGKQDIKKDGGKEKKRTLNYYHLNLHKKFLAEDPQNKDKQICF